jgi:hypothetical protein
MSARAADLRGVIHGKMIVLQDEAGLPDGQPVKVSVQPLEDLPSGLPPGEGIRRSAGGWADDPAGLDEYLEWNRKQRKSTRTPPEDLR